MLVWTEVSFVVILVNLEKHGVYAVECPKAEFNQVVWLFGMNG